MVVERPNRESLVWCALLSLAGCPALNPVTIPCLTDANCPSGSFCQANQTCGASPLAGPEAGAPDAGADGGGPDAGDSGTPACPSVLRLPTVPVLDTVSSPFAVA